MVTIIGIDPGLTGAISCIKMNNGELIDISVQDMPIQNKGKEIRKRNKAGVMTSTQKKEVDPYTLSNILARNGACIVYIEQVSAMPDQGVTGVFSFGDSFGAIRGVCGALGLAMYRVMPRAWKEAVGLIGKDKDAARLLARQLYPIISNLLTRKKDIGRADALMIAHYGLLEYNNAISNN